MLRVILSVACCIASLFVKAQTLPGLILNEVSQGGSGGTEYFEFVVTGTRTCTDSTLDLRNWIIDDNNGWIEAGNGKGIAMGCIRFKNIDAWKAIPYGSIIVVYKETAKNINIPSDDPQDLLTHDYVYILPASSNLIERHETQPFNGSGGSTYPSSGFLSGGLWSTVALANTDGVIIVKAGSLNSAYYSLGFGIGSGNSANVLLPALPDLSNYYLIDDKYNTVASWQLGAANVNETPGSPNNAGANKTWIESMRVQATGVTVNAITGTPTLCTGTTTTLSNTTPGGTWSSSNTAVATVNASGLVAGLTAGSTTITYSVTSGGCTGTATQLVTVSLTPIVAPITGSTTVCSGSTITLSNITLGGVWSSSNTAVATVNNTGIVAGVAAGNTTISYTVTNGGCSASQTYGVTVNAPPTVAAITGANTLCTGGTTTLSNATPGGTWTSSSPAVATISNTGLVNALTPGTTTITYTVTTGGCTGTATLLITVTASPALGPITGTSSLCAGATTTLSNAVSGGTWTSSNTAIATVNNSGIVTGISAGSSTITYTATLCGGPSSVTQLVTVNAIPTVAAITGNNTVCVGSTTPLANATSGGVWSSATPSVATVSPTGLITGISAGSAVISYTVTTNGCSNTSNITVTVNAVPVVLPITGNNSVCAGAATPLSNATSGGVWSSSNTAIATVNTSGVVTGVAAGNATISYTVTTSGCSASSTFPITVNANPVVPAITGNTAVCVGSTTALSNATAGGTWTSSNTAVATVSNAGLVTAVSAGTSTITYTVTTGGCTGTNTTTVTVTAPPVVPAITGTTTVCAGSTTTLSNTVAGGTWSSSNTSVATVSTAGVVTGVSAGTATITYTVTSGPCTGSNAITVTVNAAPSAGTISGNTTICKGVATNLTSSVAGGAWTSSNTAVATVSNTGVVTGLSAGTSTITYTVTTGGCTGTTTATITVQTFTLNLTATPNPAPTGATVNFVTSATTPYTITAWQPAAQFGNQTALTQTITANASGQYYAVGKTTGGCIDTARVDLVVISNVNDVFVPNYFTPNADGKNDLLYIYGSTIAEVEFKIFNQWGEEIFATKDKTQGWNGAYKGVRQPVGVYMYVAKVKLLNGVSVTKKGSINLIR